MEQPKVFIRVCHNCGDTPQEWHFQERRNVQLPNESAPVMSNVYVCQGCKPPYEGAPGYTPHLHHWEAISDAAA